VLLDAVGAAYGVLVLVFQRGMGESLLGFHSNGGISSWLPLFLFGLSMDYHVLILSRVREGVDRGLSTDEAVRQGISATAGTVTSAAVVMVAVFSIFATLSIIDMKEMGVGLAVAVLLDATIVRGVLLPAAMKLLGERNWYLPRGLRWLPLRASPSLFRPRASEDRPQAPPARRWGRLWQSDLGFVGGDRASVVERSRGRIRLRLRGPRWGICLLWRIGCGQRGSRTRCGEVAEGNGGLQPEGSLRAHGC
jgi:hypothetical protein